MASTSGTYSSVDEHSLVDMNGNKVIVACLGSRILGLVQVRRLVHQAQHRSNILSALLL